MSRQDDSYDDDDRDDDVEPHRQFEQHFIEEVGPWPINVRPEVLDKFHEIEHQIVFAISSDRTEAVVRVAGINVVRVWRDGDSDTELWRGAYALATQDEAVYLAGDNRFDVLASAMTGFLEQPSLTTFIDCIRRDAATGEL